MNHYRAVIEQDPAAFSVSFNSHAAVTQIVFQLVVNLFADGVQLPSAGTGGQDKVVTNGSQLTQIENYDVGAPIVFRRTGRRDGQFQTPLRIGGFRFRRCGNGCHSSVEGM